MNYAPASRSPSQLHALGMENERRFFDAMLNHSVNLPNGVYKVEHATPEEDARGIDGWVLTRYGRIPLQIKSSCEGIHQHLKHYPDLNAVIVVVHCTESVREIQENTLSLFRKRLEREQAKLNTKRRAAR